jgi:hypothetical protein
MAKQKHDKPTSSGPIFVGLGPGEKHATQFVLTIVEWVLRGEEVALRGPVEGEISAWIAHVWDKPIEFDRQDPPGKDRAAIQQETLREAFAISADPGKKEEKQLVELLGSISLDDAQRLSTAVGETDVSGSNKIRSEIADKLSERITPELISAMSSFVARGRAVRAAALCTIRCKEHPLTLIARARQGDRQAVLDLIKIDKLFLTDSCTSQVIRQAELHNDHRFLQQIARALRYKVKMGWRGGCRLYLYLVFAMGLELPSLTLLQLRVDPAGTRFRTFPAFQKFVERCRGEFRQWQASLPCETPEKKE